MLKSMKMVKVLSQLTEEYPHGCNVGKYLMVEPWRSYGSISICASSQKSEGGVEIRWCPPIGRRRSSRII